MRLGTFGGGLGSWLVAVIVTSCAGEPPTSSLSGQTTSALRRGAEQLEWFSVGTPPTRRDGALTYDEARQHLVLFGGVGATATATETWRDVWEHDARLGWHERTETVAGPTGRVDFGLVYDGARQRSVMFGGRNFDGLPLRELWEWDGFSWTSHADVAGGPSARSGSAMVYDRARARSLVFGGQTYDQHPAGDFWEWDGETWKERSTASGPSARADASITYDVDRARVVLFGGRLQGNALTSELWEWDGLAWRQPTLTGPQPSARYDAALAYDETRHRVVMFGGSSSVGAPEQSAELWEWDGAAWEQRTAAGVAPTARQGALLTYDPRSRAVVLVGGAEGALTVDDEWHWDGVSWSTPTGSRARPPSRQFPTMVYDPVRERALSFGGFALTASAVTSYADLWEWTRAGGWIDRSTTPAPPGRSSPHVAYDSAREQVVVFGGAEYLLDGSITRLGDTWIHDGTQWSEPVLGSAPGARAGAAFAYDPARARTMLFGGILAGAAAYSQDTWEWDGVAWTERVPAAGSPPARSLAAMAYDPWKHQLLLFGGIDLAGPINDLWTWDGARWSALEGTDGVRPPRKPGTLVASAERGSMLLVSAASPDTFGARTDVWEWAEGRWSSLPLARAPVAIRDFAVSAILPNAMMFGGASEQFLSNTTDVLVARGGPCTSAADSTTGFCVDGVSCTSAVCATCETCADPSDAGRCVAIRAADDADTCGADRTCDGRGRCRLVVGSVATDPAACVSGFATDGVCCESESCGPCRTCNASEKEIADNPGRCGTRKAGTDPGNECNEEPATSCGYDGTCDGRGDCRKYVSGTACGPVVQQGPRVSSSTCSGNGVCLPVDASCDGDHTLVVAGAAPVDCGAYGCEGASCKTECTSIMDCASGFFCDDQRTCKAPAESAPSTDGGCSCRIGEDSQPQGTLLLGALVVLWLARRRRGLLVASGILASAACVADPGTKPIETSRAALTGDETLTWKHVIGLPSPRYDAMMTYDSVRSGLFLIGGTNGGQTLGDIYRDQWWFDGARWTEQTPRNGGPSQRSAGSLAYDRLRGHVLLFSGGLSPAIALPNEDLWQWDGAVWTRLEPRGAVPRGRYYASMTYDEARDRVVLFGGSGSTFADDTWEWDGVSWQERTPSSGGPGARTGASFVYDPVRRVSVLFGGRTEAGYLAETWEWDGATWTDRSTLSAVSPPARWLAGTTYDRNRSRMVIFAGATNLVNNQVWERDSAGVWEQRTPAAGGPGMLVAGSLAYDEVRQRTVAFGGVLNSTALGELWDWDGTEWTARTPPAQPPTLHSTASTYDVARGRVLLFGGFDGDVTDSRGFWSWDGAIWSNRTAPIGPSPRRGASMASSADKVLLFGGYEQTAGTLSDLWQWDGAAWLERTPASGSPAPRLFGTLTYDQARARWVMFGGSGAQSLFADTWEWDGAAWLESHPVHSPSARYAHTLSYDSDRHVVVLFGGRDPNAVASRELWEWNGSDWTDRTQPNAGPAAAPRAVADYDAQLHRTLFVLSPGSAFGRDSEVWAWDGTSWTQVPADLGPPLIGSYSFAIDAARHRGVLFGVMNGSRGETWELQGRGAPCSSDADASTGHCVDGVSCVVAACPGVCQSCNVPGAVGTCASVTLTEDPDTCRNEDKKSCDAAGTCKAALGAPAITAAECVSGYLVDGVCCETASCAFCATCSAAQKEIQDNDGRCGTQRAGLDLRDECAATPAQTCGDDGTCNGRGECAKYARGTACSEAGSQVDAICTGAGECVVQTAVCDGEGAVRAPSGKVSSCAGYRCKDGACQTTCVTVNDCIAGSVCDPEGRCLPESNADVAADGCSCETPGSARLRPWSWGLVAMFALMVARRRRENTA